MMGRIGALVALVVVFVALAPVSASDIPNNFINKSIKRKIDATGFVVKTRLTFKVEATSTSSKYYVAIPKKIADRIVHITASAKDKFAPSIALAADQSNDEFTMYKMTLKASVEEGSAATLKVEYLQARALRPYPVEITQAENQLVIYEDDAYVASPYKTTTMNTVISIGKNTIESFTDDYSPASYDETSVKYGPYKDQAAFASGANVAVHFINNSPFKTMETVEKEIEVSHWGNIAVEEQYDLHHTGAKLKNGFSRIDYQMHRKQSSSFRGLFAVIPHSAKDVYYRDIIGNISTSHLRMGSEGAELEIDARFPIFGGWHTQWYQGYNLPTRDFLSVDSNAYTLEIDAGVPFKDVFVEDFTLKVVLPETATDVQVESKVDFTREDSLRFTYLDVNSAGRPVVVLRGKNIVHESDTNIKVTYNMAGSAMLREPIFLITFYFILFFTYSVGTRLNFSLK